MAYQAEQFFSIWQSPVRVTVCLPGIHAVNISEGFPPRQWKLREGGIFAPHESGKMIHNRLPVL